MTKFLHPIVLALVVSGWVAPLSVEADISADGALTATSSTVATDAATAPKTTRQKKRKSSVIAASTNVATGNAPTANGKSLGSAAPNSESDTRGTSPAIIAKNSRKKHHGKAGDQNAAGPTEDSATRPGAKAAAVSSTPTAEPAPVSGAAAAAASTVATAEAAPQPGTKSSRKKRHGKTDGTAANIVPGNVTTATTTTNASPIPSPASELVPKTSASTPQTLPATGSPSTLIPTSNGTGAILPAITKSSRRHKHGKNDVTAKTSPGPAIMVTPSSVPLSQQPTPVIHPIGSGPVAPPPSVTFGPTVQTGLPVARPGTGTTANLPGLVPSIRMETHTGTSTQVYPSTALKKFPFSDFPLAAPRRHTQVYPWKQGIITTVFWIGEAGSSVSATTNYQSAWNANWMHDNSGSDNQDDMSGYASSLHASTLNPFYIALPFNDLVYPDKARRWIPGSWFKPPRDGKAVSACQNRWIEIKNRAGRTCYAQWEDVGPLRYDHAEYVFGDERPNTLTHAGLDVSPAVALYLGIDRHGSGITSWRFVDDDDVQPGMWLKYDEQAIIFKALKEQQRRTPRIQDLSEPTPDDNSQNANQKKAGAARG